ncbi:hypothetical protein BT63DRAFT_481035 [Microthyrium microscopicum]|uniref:BZIP domain-containing protein n=1 Tax=Microthyrium microscopicum TaxID=703497 RepID=A0A6A6U4L5_9PEZI|nr:hypothetical protein BT63DRAFT_481035 [Microthyrium microscopicum]
MEEDSPADAPSPTVSNTNPRGAGAKKRGGTISSRSVASLTPEQLEKKRRNDREAQRAIRERTKHQIDRLNDKIREYELSQPYQELQAVIRQKEIIQAENEELKRKMLQASNLLNPQSGASLTSLSGLDALVSASERATPGNGGPSATLPPMQGPPYIPASIPAIQSPLAQASSPGTQTTRSYGGTPPATAAVPGRSWVSPSPSNFVDQSPRPGLGGEAYQPGDERHSVGFVIDNTNTKFVRVPYNTRQTPPTSSPGAIPPVYTILPRVTESCALDVLLLDYLVKSQRLAAEGVSPSELAGPVHSTFNSLANPKSTFNAHPLSKFFTDILQTFPDISRVPEQVAVTYVMHTVMRWQIHPTRENYELLPSYSVPPASSIIVPHPAWMDHLPWPRLRDATIMQVPSVPFDVFFVPYTTTFSINWPYSDDMCLAYDTSVPVGPGGEQPLIVSPLFEAHIRELNNWSLGPAFREEFPLWERFVRIRED